MKFKLFKNILLVFFTIITSQTSANFLNKEIEVKIDSIILQITKEESSNFYNPESYKYLKKVCYSATPYRNRLNSYIYSLSKFNNEEHINLLGNIYTEIGGLYDDPLIYNLDSSKYYLDTVLLFVEKLEPFIQLNTYRRLTSTYKFLNLYDEAMSFCLKGIEIGEKINDTYNLKSLYYNMASLSVKSLKSNNLQNNDKIKLYLDKAMSLVFIEGNPEAIANFYYMYAKKISEIEEFGLAFNALDSCEKYTKRSDVINTSTGKTVYTSLQLTRGGIHLQLNNIDSAEFYFEKALQLSIKHNFKERLKDVPMQLANVAVRKRNYLKAINIVNSVFSENQENLILFDLERGNKILYEANDSLGNTNQSLKYLKIWRIYKDSLDKLNDINIIVGLENKYKNKEQKKQINFQKQTITAQNKQQKTYIFFLCSLSLLSFGLFFMYRKVRSSKNEINSQKNIISLALEEKEILLKEVHHRVKNNLQVMSGLLQLQSNTSSNEELKTALHQSQNRIYSIAIIHELLYQDKEIKEINANDYFHQIVELNSKIQENKANLKLITNQLVLSMDQAIPLGLILNELTINSYKHAFFDKKQGEIKIILTRINNQYNFKYSDNGNGMNDSIDILKTKSLGLRLIKMMCKQLHANLKITNNNGSTFEIQF